jgi:anti-sigma regulatory factor (Ser/Thr protein kinase)
VEVAVRESVRIQVEDPSQVAEARRVARLLATRLGFDEVCVEQIAIVITEASTNLLKHAGKGEILLRSTAEDDSSVLQGLEAIVLDRGPGMANLDRCIQDGYSTGDSPGQGLGAIIRLSTVSDFYTVPSKGTVLLARWPISVGDEAIPTRSKTMQVGAVNVCKPGQEVCGDSWGVEHSKGETVVLVADGLGHGVDARVASIEAVRMLRLNPDLTPKNLLEHAHLALRSTRGAAVAVARIDRDRRVLTFAGVGNISAQIYAGPSASHHLVSSNGTAGHQIPRLQEFSYPWPENGVLILHSDGLSGGTGLEDYPRLMSRDPSLAAAVLYRDYSKGNDDSTVVVVKAAA